jgi:hypothetical protein
VARRAFSTGTHAEIMPMPETDAAAMGFAVLNPSGDVPTG